MTYSARVIADSISPLGSRLTSIEVTFPRFVLAEFNTHRVFSRNSASSRAIPVEKQLARIEQNPFIPIYWGKNQKGMVAELELDELATEEAKKEWLAARDSALKHTRRLMEIGVHKQLANRLLEPFMWQTVICTATEWDNFYALRNHADAQPEIREAARIMKLVHDENVPRKLNYGEWHLPLLTDEEVKEYTERGLDVRKISSGRCARISYLTHDGRRDPLADIELADRLQASGHMSPFEHVAAPLTVTEAQGILLSHMTESNDIPCVDMQDMFCGNFRGWQQFRKTIPNEDNYARILL